ncbi:hypothetical protein [Alphaproteobacteria bacterium endosymbiont of Tiliacea citrago]|uniref:hypothetical protein n=1 Tax=Alphaproteobacteria bacterium endosymbiont of Tiliacea citrago TaxID=3077944 RepID=UPI00313B2DEB
MSIFLRSLCFLLNLFTFFNICFALEVIISMLLALLVYLQKNSEEFSTQTKLSAPSSRSDFRIKSTYFLVVLFIINTCILNILYQREYKNYIVTDQKKY